MTNFTDDLAVIDDALTNINEAMVEMDQQEVEFVERLISMRLSWVWNEEVQPRETVEEKPLHEYMYCWREGDTDAYATHYVLQEPHDSLYSVCGEHMGTKDGWYRVVGPDDPAPADASHAWWRVGDERLGRNIVLCQRCRYGTKRSKEQRNG